jgi:sulfur-oxidizing protein SoxZ
MADAMKIRATMEGGSADVKVLIQHAMDTGTQKDPKTEKLIPAHFINQVVATLNGKTVIDTQWGAGVAKNPFMGFKIKGAKPGDKVGINAVDNLGNKFDGEAVIA